MTKNAVSRQETQERLRLERALSLLQHPDTFETWIKWQRHTYQRNVNPLSSFLRARGVSHVQIADRELVAGQSVASLPPWAIALLSKMPARGAIHARYLFTVLHEGQIGQVQEQQIA